MHYVLSLLLKSCQFSWLKIYLFIMKSYTKYKIVNGNLQLPILKLWWQKIHQERKHVAHSTNEKQWDSTLWHIPC